MKNMFKIGICLLVTICDRSDMNAGFGKFKAFTALAKARLQHGLRAKILGAGLVAGAGVTTAGVQEGQKQQQNTIANVKITTGGAIVSHDFVSSPFSIYAYLGGSPWSDKDQSPTGNIFNPLWV